MLLCETSLLTETEAFLKSLAITVLNNLHILWSISCNFMLCFIPTLSSGIMVTASPDHNNVHTWILFWFRLTYSFIWEVCFYSHQGLLKDEAVFISCKIFSSGSYHTTCTWHHTLQDSSVHSCCNETPKSHILNLCSCSSQVIFCSLWCLTLCAFFGAICYWHLGRNKWTTCQIWCIVSTLLTFCNVRAVKLGTEISLWMY
jgi:hypothetical protein